MDDKYEFRVTVEDLKTGEKQVTEFAPGDYNLTVFGDCYLAHTQAHANGTHVLTIKDIRPQARPRRVPNAA